MVYIIITGLWPTVSRRPLRQHAPRPAQCTATRMVPCSYGEVRLAYKKPLSPPGRIYVVVSE